MELDIIKGKKVAELREIAAALHIEGAAKMKKSEIIALLTKMHEEAEAARTSQPEESAVKAEEPEAQPEVLSQAEAEDSVQQPVKKKRGRPRKKADAAAAEDNEKPAVPAPAEEEAAAQGEALGEPSVELEGDAEIPVCEEAEGEPDACEEPDDGKPRAPYKVQKEGRYETTGILDIAEGGFGFLRYDNFLTSDEDIYVSPTQIRRFNLKTGDEIFGIARRPGAGERFGALLYVTSVNGDEPGVAIRRRDFSDLTPIYPNERIYLEKGSSTLSMRLTDLVAPIGKGQRGLIVAPPKAGKTTLLKQIAKAIEKQELDVELIVLLIDERPEEVTDMQRSINGTVIYSTFDEQPSHHVKVAEMVLARAQRLVEHGKDVVILMDSITRLARAYNLVEQPSGRTLSGGLDPAALYKPKKFFGAARNIEEGGSITILATALIETGSRMDDMIFEEFKGTGNMELHLDRKLQEKRIFPALNLNKSGTRREDMLMSQEELEAVWMMRRAVADWGVAEATEKIVLDLAHTRKNSEFVERFRKTRL